MLSIRIGIYDSRKLSSAFWLLRSEAIFEKTHPIIQVVELELAPEQAEEFGYTIHRVAAGWSCGQALTYRFQTAIPFLPSLDDSIVLDPISFPLWRVERITSSQIWR